MTRQSDDRIVYVILNGAGRPVFAHQDRWVAERRLADGAKLEKRVDPDEKLEKRVDPDEKLEKRVVDYIETLGQIAEQLDPVERLVFGDLLAKANAPVREWDHSEGNRG